MSATERRRATLASFFGTFTLMVQLWVLWRFLEELKHDVDITNWVERSVLFTRMAWLKAPLWQPPWFERYVAAFLAMGAGLCAWLTIGGLVRLWRRRGKA